MQKKLKQQNQSLSMLVMYISIVVTALTYSTSGWIAQIATTIMPLLWILCLLIRLYECRGSISFTKNLLFMLALYLAYAVKCESLYLLRVHPIGGLGPARSLYLCLIFYYIGYTSDDIERAFDRLIKIYLVITTVLGLELVYIALSPDFMYWEYNAAHAAILVGICPYLLLNYYKPRFWLFKIGKVVIVVAILVGLLFLHTRTPLVCAILCIVYGYLYDRKGVKSALKVLLVAAIILAIGIFTGLFDQLVDELFPRNMESRIDSFEALDTFSSGRATIFLDNWSKFLSSPVVGVGNWAYADNFILYVLGSGGILSAVLLFPVAYYLPFKIAFDKKKPYTDVVNQGSGVTIGAFARMLVIYYSLASLTVGSPPLGTGTMVFLPWIIYGMRQKLLESELS